MAENKIEKVASGVWRQQIPGTDLEVNFNVSGSDLVVRVNKGFAQIFRAVLRGAAEELTDKQLSAFNAVGPYLSFRVGDTEAGIRRLAQSAGMDPS
jgi:hypothetical protein